MKTIRVFASREYDVVIAPGLLAECGERIAAVTGVCRVCVVSDTNVFPLYGEEVTKSLENAGFSVTQYVIPAGESSKNLAVYGALLEHLAAMQLGRGDILAALGGGVVGDLTGFAAATYQRGVRFVQLPTTLLAAVDSSVGGKAAVDLPQGKNLVGSFHQPSLVLCDTDTLATLPSEQLRSGAAEAIKCAVLGLPELFARMEAGSIADMAEEVIAECVGYKRDVVQADEFDTGERAKLNLGHTVGHAIEKCSGFSLTHGECVAAGLAVIVRASVERKILDNADGGRILSLLEKNALPLGTGIGLEELYTAALSDKKRSGDTVKLIMPVGIGNCRIVKISTFELRNWMRDGGVR